MTLLPCRQVFLTHSQPQPLNMETTSRQLTVSGMVIQRLKGVLGESFSKGLEGEAWKKKG